MTIQATGIMSNSGIFGDLVANAGALVAAVAALSIAMLWVSPVLSPDHSFAWRFRAMEWAGLACLLGLLIYSALRTIYVFDQEYAIGPKHIATRKVIGGLWLTPIARA